MRCKIITYAEWMRMWLVVVVTYLKAALEKLRNPVHNFRITGNQTENSAMCLQNTSLGVTATVTVPILNVSISIVQPTRCTR